jgi:hypothetical protein
MRKNAIDYWHNAGCVTKVWWKDMPWLQLTKDTALWQTLQNVGLHKTREFLDPPNNWRSFTLIFANTYGNYLFDILVCGQVTTKTTQLLKGDQSLQTCTQYQISWRGMPCNLAVMREVKLTETVLVNNKLDAQFFFLIYLFRSSTCFEQPRINFILFKFSLIPIVSIKLKTVLGLRHARFRVLSLLCSRKE